MSNEVSSGRYPTVAIVGRPNVGKSAIFNRLAGRRISIVHDQPGVTRDRVAATCTSGTFPFSLIDPGGIGGGSDELFTAQVETEVAIAIETADLILFVVDGRDGKTPIDREVGVKLLKANTPVILVVNKLDHEKQAHLQGDFEGMGFDQPHGISAAHGAGFEQLLDRITTELAAMGKTPEALLESATPDLEMRLALLGKPNAGKSSLINAILKDDRTIVSELAGTTRDAIDIPYERDGQRYLLIDTAGIRPKNRRDSSVEIFSSMRAEKSVHRAHLCALVIDSATGVTSQDRKIAQLILEAGKPCLIILNKFDLYHPDAKFHDRLEELEEHVRRELFFLNYAPMVAVSALKRDHIGQIFKGIRKIVKAAHEGPATGELNRMLEFALEKYPPPARKSGHRLKILYATLAKKKVETPLPVPRIVLFVNKRLYLTDTYSKYLENQIRSRAPFTGLPLRFDLRERSKKDTV
ncbi:ribosome biogenesis GTPase Der [soil metagenome]